MPKLAVGLGKDSTGGLDAWPGPANVSVAQMYSGGDLNIYELAKTCS